MHFFFLVDGKFKPVPFFPAEISQLARQKTHRPNLHALVWGLKGEYKTPEASLTTLRVTLQAEPLKFYLFLYEAYKRKYDAVRKGCTCTVSADTTHKKYSGTQLIGSPTVHKE